ncbi:MAG: AAA family ATPase [Deltaproteobacteria bacterium]|nr:AAA family ATPase [Deltaproteobacteria bacterium]
MKLNSLSIKNFKGIKSFEFIANGKYTTIYGNNGTGKTTVFDAFTWLLFDKDSMNKSNFEIKPLAENNEPIHGLESEVEAVLDIDGMELILKKVFKEKWTKARGAAKQVFSGHTTDYYIDEVPVKKKDFTDKISELADESVFKLLTNPFYFNEHLHWKEQRDILVKVCGDISDNEVVSKNDKLAKLADVIGKRTIEQHKAVIKEKQKKINGRLESIPDRIDEVNRGKPDISGMDFEDLRIRIQGYTEGIEQSRQQLSDIKNNIDVAKKQREIVQIETELIKLENEHGKKLKKELAELGKKKGNIEDDICKKDRAIARIQEDIDELEASIKTIEKDKKELLEKYHELDKSEFVSPEAKTICSSCGQELPEEQIEEARRKSLENFNLEKSEKIKKIKTEGLDKKTKLENKKAELDKLKTKKTDLSTEVSQLNSKLDGIIAEIEELSESIGDVKESKTYKEKLAAKEKLKSEIVFIRESRANETKALEESIEAVEKEIEKLQIEVAKEQQFKDANSRIKELREEERKLAAEIEKLEEELYLCEEFERTQAEMLESKVNNRFQIANFKLFKNFVNGGNDLCCEMTINGVPYNSLNHGSKVNGGLDIINVLSEFYSFEAPIFIDFAESVTSLLPTKAQTIKLVVSEKDKKLRVE